MVTQELMQSFKIVALFRLTDSGVVNFTLKYIIVGDVGVGVEGNATMFRPVRLLEGVLIYSETPSFARIDF